MSVSCATGTLDPYIPSADQPWNKARVIHLARRLGFGLNLEGIDYALSADPVSVVNNQLDFNAAIPADPPPFWADYVIGDFNDIDDNFVFASDFTANWVQKMNATGLKEKMILFWSNHFVTEFVVYEYAPFLYKYYTKLEEHAFGNFKDFVREIGLSQAMLLYLNGAENTKFNPNENYARELYELFTLGVDNGYTQTDIEETARALTGWTLNPTTYEVIFANNIHDTDDKTIFGVTGNFDYDDVIDLLFEERSNEIAYFMCEKIYKHFVGPNVDETIVQQLADLFISNNWELMPVYKALFASEHFFDQANMATIVKSPMEYFLPFTKEMDFDLNTPFPPNPDISWSQIIYFVADSLGQSLFSPIDVAGWPGNRTWLNSNTLVNRWELIDNLSLYFADSEPDMIRNFVKDLSGNSTDPFVVTMAVLDHYIPQGLQNAQAIDQAVDVFKWEIPENYFDLGIWNLDLEEAKWQIAVLMQHIARLPEFQLS